MCHTKKNDVIKTLKTNSTLGNRCLKKVSCLFVILIFCITLFANTAPVPPSNFNESNAGTAENPYLISNLANLRWLSETSDVWGEVDYDEDTDEYELISKFYFRQTAHIDASETISWNDGDGFTPIGFAIMNIYDEEGIALPFIGDYDGGNFIISNLYIHAEIPDEDQFTVGMFGFIILSNISNVNLHNLQIINGDSIGGIAGLTEQSVIQNCGVTGSISGETYVVGSLVGQALTSVIENCYAVLDINVNSRMSTGGLIGAIIDSQLNNSFYIGKIFDENDFSSHSIGGISGMAIFGLIENVYIVITEASENVYGLVTDLTFSDISNSFWNTEISGITEAFREEIFSEVEDIYGLSTAEMKLASTYIAYGWDFDTIWTIEADKNDGYPILKFMPDPIVSENDKTDVILPLTVSWAYPNPVIGETVNIRWNVTNQQKIGQNTEISIYNVRGQLVKKSSDLLSLSGNNLFSWDRKNEYGQDVANGVYFYRININGETVSGRFVLIK